MMMMMMMMIITCVVLSPNLDDFLQASLYVPCHTGKDSTKTQCNAVQCNIALKGCSDAVQHDTFSVLDCFFSA